MGRWYAALKNQKTPPDRTDKTDKTHPDTVSSVLSVPSVSEFENFRVPPDDGQGGFVSFVGSPSERIEEFFAVSPPAAWDAEDWQMAFEERAAILEYDGGFTRSEAERLARIEIEALRKTSGI